MRDWDLWGPLILCLILAVITGFSTKKSLSFAVVFVIVCVGSIIVTINAKVLGGQVSFFQAVCTLGYCMFPLVVAAMIIKVVSVTTGFNSIIFRGVFVLVTLLWSIWASFGFMSSLVDQKRRALAVYPVVLFYVILAWLVLSQIY